MAPLQDGVFTGFDLEDPTSISQLIRGLEYWLSNRGQRRYPNNDAVRDLSPVQRVSLRAIDGRMRREPEFSEVVETFLQTDPGHHCLLVTAAAGIAAYAVVDAQEDAVAAGPNLVIQPRPTESHPTQPRSTRPRLIIRTPLLSNSTVKLEHADKRHQLPDGRPSAISFPSPQRLPKRRTPSRHAPTLQRGYECYKDDTVDRAHVKMGEPNESKFVISLPSRKANPKKPGEWIQGKGATYNYPNRIGFTIKGKLVTLFDWNSKKHIKALHQWREQIFRRRIGGVRSTRAPWLEREKQTLLSMIEEQLKTHRRPRWNKLANQFNQYFEGQIQRKGEKQVFKGKKLDGGYMAEDRPAPWRTRSALEGQTFKWHEYSDMLEEKDKEDAASDTNDLAVESDDEDEIPDPTPIQTEFKPRKKKPVPQKPRKRRMAKKSDTPASNVTKEGFLTIRPATPFNKFTSTGTKRKHVEVEGEVADREEEDEDEEDGEEDDNDYEELSDISNLTDIGDLDDPFN